MLKQLNSQICVILSTTLGQLMYNSAHFFQTVTGRNLKYNQAMRIVQDEEYLAATDKSIIRCIQNLTHTKKLYFVPRI
jgi:hypothetical protein